MQKQLTCTICSQQYRQNNVPRLLPKCGHSFCQSCIKSNLEEKDNTFKIVCPQDSLQMTFDDKDINNFPKNIALIKLLCTKEAKKKDQSFKDGSLNESNIAKHSNTDADEQDKQLLTVINQSTRGTQPIDNKSGEDLDLKDTCLIHMKPLQIVCIKDKTKICSTCAIFGDHKGHDFKSIDQVAKDKQKRYDGILHLIDKKQLLESRLSGKETREQFSRNLNAKKQALSKDIKAKFSRIADAVKNAQKNVMLKLNKNFSSLQERVKDQLKMPDSVNKKYQKWEQRAYRQIKSFDGYNNFEEQLKLLNYQNTDNQLNIIDQGEFIMSQIQRCVSMLDDQKVQITNSINIEFSPQLEKNIQEYAVLTVKQTKKIALAIASPRQSTTKTMGFKGIYQEVIPRKNPQQSTLSLQSNIQKPLPQPPTLGHQNVSNPDDFLLQLHEDNVALEQEPVVREIIDIKQEIPVLSLKQQVPKQSFGHQHAPSQYSISVPQDTNRKTAYKDSSFVFQKLPTKKKPKIKLAEKYQKILDGIINDQLQTVDFTNAELGDQVMIQIVQCIRSKKVKTLKLIRNKLTDQGLDKMFPYFGGIITLNLSQNLLTERFVEQLIVNLPRMPSLRSIILSQNKIKERNIKVRLEEIKKYQVIVSL